MHNGTICNVKTVKKSKTSIHFFWYLQWLVLACCTAPVQWKPLHCLRATLAVNLAPVDRKAFDIRAGYFAVVYILLKYIYFGLKTGHFTPNHTSITRHHSVWHNCSLLNSNWAIQFLTALPCLWPLDLSLLLPKQPICLPRNINMEILKCQLSGNI